MRFGGGKQRLELAALEGIDFARVDDRDDAQAQRAGVRAHLGHQPLQLRVVDVDAPQVGETIRVERDRPLRERELGANSAIRQHRPQRRSHLRVEPAALGDEQRVDSDRVHGRQSR